MKWQGFLNYEKSQKSKNLTRRVYYKKYKNLGKDIFCYILWVFLIFLPHPKLRKIFMTLQTFQEPSFTLPHMINSYIFYSFLFFILLHPSCCCCLVTKSCPIFCNPRDYSPPCSSAHEISQARILEWIAISFSRGSSWPRDWIHISSLAGTFFTTEPPGKPWLHPTELLFHNLPMTLTCNLKTLFPSTYRPDH